MTDDEDDGVEKVLPPGNPRAVELGCKCDPERNQHGKGVSGNPLHWHIDWKCPIHGVETPLRMW